MFVVDSLLRPDALVELEIRVERDLAYKENNIINLQTLTPSDDIDENDVVAQTLDIYDQADKILQITGFKLSDIVKTVDSEAIIIIIMKRMIYFRPFLE